MGQAPLGLIFLIGAGFCFLFAGWGIWAPQAAWQPWGGRLVAVGLLLCVVSKFFGVGL